MSSEVLVSSLAASFEAGFPVFVLVDPMLGEPIAVDAQRPGDLPSLNRARESAWSRPIHVVTLASSIELPSHLHPYLVELQGPSDAWLSETLRTALQERDLAHAGGLAGTGTAPHRIGGWLQSSLEVCELTRSLGQMMKVNTQAFTPARYQRLADRRVLEWLRQVVGIARLTAQMGRVRRWSYLDACGVLAHLLSTEEATTPLRLTTAEWSDFMRGERLHPTVARWLGACAGRPSPVHLRGDVATLYRRAAAAIERAEAVARRWPRRFVTPADRAAWAVLTLLHPQIESMPHVLAALAAAPAPDEPPETLDTLCPALDAMCLKAT